MKMIKSMQQKTWMLEIAPLSVFRTVVKQQMQMINFKNLIN